MPFGNGIATDHGGDGKNRNALQLIAEKRGLNLLRQDELREAADELAGFLGVRLEGSGRRTERLLAAPKTPQKTVRDPVGIVDAEPVWKALLREDALGHEYLSRRHLVPSPDELLRYSTGSSGNEFLDYLAGLGFRCAFALRDSAGRIRSISVRFAGDKPPDGMPKIMNLKDAPTKGLAFVREGVRYLDQNDPEYQSDEICICEGPTDVLALVLYFERESCEGRSPYVWILGSPGAGNAPATIKAFASAVRGRVIHVALDTDPAGESHVKETVLAAREAGARLVKRLTFPPFKDAAAAREASHE